ncbi:ADP-ribosylglycohydrolase family protein [Kitasatospora sp. MMS16-BH015]|uniref:ADP-ribosylglycohydrolase family protein n=1 Tax=Kitasatospora sp. MMS16-BH015 TaxID=2018025 RepID=UPI000CF2AA20
MNSSTHFIHYGSSAGALRPRTTHPSGGTVEAAIRAAPLGAWGCEDLDEAAEQAAFSAEATHAHPGRIAGAVTTALAAALAARSRNRPTPTPPTRPPSRTRPCRLLRPSCSKSKSRLNPACPCRPPHDGAGDRQTRPRQASQRGGRHSAAGGAERTIREPMSW